MNDYTNVTETGANFHPYIYILFPKLEIITVKDSPNKNYYYLENKQLANSSPLLKLLY